MVLSTMELAQLHNSLHQSTNLSKVVQTMPSSASNNTTVVFKEATIANHHQQEVLTHHQHNLHLKQQTEAQHSSQCWQRFQNGYNGFLNGYFHIFSYSSNIKLL